MKNNPIICLLALTCTISSISAAHATTEPDRVSAVLELQDADVASLKQTGYIKMAIPSGLRDRVDSVILKRPVRFKDESAILFNTVDRHNAMVSISVDDSTIEQIDYQPVELKIYESGFSSIVVHYSPGNSATPRKASKGDSAVFVTNMANAKSLTGRIAAMKTFTIKSELGTVDVALDDVSQITFEDDDRVSVTLENGDRLSGNIAFRNLTINSRWGLEDLKVADIVSISKVGSSMSKAPGTSIMTQSTPMGPINVDAAVMPMAPVGIPAPMAFDAYSMPMSVPQPIVTPQSAMPDYSPLQSFLYPSENTYDPNGQRVDVVPRSLDQPIGQGYAPYTGQQVFDQAVDQLMQPGVPAMQQPVEMMPTMQTFGPFFDGPLPTGEQPIGGFGEIIQSQQNLPQGQVYPEGITPDAGSDFWFFPQ